MTCNDTTEYAVIYELEHIVAEMTIHPEGKADASTMNISLSTVRGKLPKRLCAYS